MKKIFFQTIVLISFLVNCGSFTYQYSYPEKYRNILDKPISKIPNIAVLVKEEDVRSKGYNHLLALQKKYTEMGIPLQIATEKTDINKFDLLISDYKIVRESPRIIPTLSFFANILTLGIIPYYSPTDEHITITTYRLHDKKNITIQFTEHFKMQNGWIPWIIGKNNGHYVPDYNRYYYDQEPAVLHPSREFNMIIFEATQPNI
ncbi:hypothetical protein P3G55_18395 [Leptospira sp. 96542]|nr:hypothetical protein [Leptospira sp. 96542]